MHLQLLSCIKQSSHVGRNLSAFKEYSLNDQEIHLTTDDTIGILDFLVLPSFPLEPTESDLSFFLFL